MFGIVLFIRPERSATKSDRERSRLSVQECGTAQHWEGTGGVPKGVRLGRTDCRHIGRQGTEHMIETWNLLRYFLVCISLLYICVVNLQMRAHFPFVISILNHERFSRGQLRARLTVDSFNLFHKCWGLCERRQYQRNPHSLNGHDCHCQLSRSREDRGRVMDNENLAIPSHRDPSHNQQYRIFPWQ